MEESKERLRNQVNIELSAQQNKPANGRNSQKSNPSNTSHSVQRAQTNPMTNGGGNTQGVTPMRANSTPMTELPPAPADPQQFHNDPGIAAKFNPYPDSNGNDSDYQSDPGDPMYAAGNRKTAGKGKTAPTASGIAPAYASGAGDGGGTGDTTQIVYDDNGMSSSEDGGKSPEMVYAK